MPGLPTPANLADPAFQAARSDAQLRDVLKNGKGSMPPLGQLMEAQELDQLIAYLRTLPEQH